MTLKLRLTPRPSIIARVTPRLSGATIVAGDGIDVVQSGSEFTISVDLSELGQTVKYLTADFGVVPDGVTSNTTAMNDAIAYANANGGNVTFIVPTGTTLYGALDTILVNGVSFVAEGASHTCILKTSAGLGISIGNNGTSPEHTTFINVGFDNAGSASTAVWVYRGSYVRFFSPWLGTGMSTFVVAGTTTPTNANLIEVFQPYGNIANHARALFQLVSGAGFFVYDPDIFVGDTAAISGRHFIEAINRSWDTIKVQGGLLQIFDRPLNISGENGFTISNIFWDDVVCDGFKNGHLFNAEAGGNVLYPIIKGGAGWLSCTDGAAVTFSGAGTHFRPSVKDLEIVRTGTGGIICTATDVTDLTIDGIGFGDQINGSTGANDGIAIAGGAGYEGLEITNIHHNENVSSDRFRYGINLQGVVDHAIIALNDMRGSTAAYEGFIADTSTTRAHTNYKQFGNIGLRDAASDDGWTAYSPAITALAGTFTSVSATGRYKQIGKIVHVMVSVTITTNGTAATGIVVPMPVAPQLGTNVIGVGRENAATGFLLIVFGTGSNLVVQKYDGTYGFLDGYNPVISVAYEAA